MKLPLQTHNKTTCEQKNRKNRRVNKFESEADQIFITNVWLAESIVELVLLSSPRIGTKGMVPNFCLQMSDEEWRLITGGRKLSFWETDQIIEEKCTGSEVTSEQFQNDIQWTNYT